MLALTELTNITIMAGIMQEYLHGKKVKCYNHDAPSTFSIFDYNGRLP
jgi:hypothetical protein